MIRAISFIQKQPAFQECLHMVNLIFVTQPNYDFDVISRNPVLIIEV